jgi:hypothetical protein
MVDEHGGRALEMTRVHDQQQVETLRSDSANEPFGDPIRFRYLNRRAKDSGALGLKHSVKAAREFAIVIAKQKANGLRALSQGPRHLPRLLGDPVPVGMGLAARCTRRLAISMKNGTYNRWNQTVSTVKKSVAITLFACARRKSRHDGPPRAGPAIRDQSFVPS